MVLHLIVLAKLKLKLLATPATAASHGSIQVVASLVFPYIFRVATSFTSLVRVGYVDLQYSSRLFMFQLMQIVLHCNQLNHNEGTRWHRALRLVSQSMARVRRYIAAPRHEDHEGSLYDVSMVAL